jgi:hypothetical protein
MAIGAAEYCSDGVLKVAREPRWLVKVFSHL